MGSGLSSSAALEVAVLRALRQMLGLDLDDVQIAQYAQRAEIRICRRQCGIMDQMASSLADTGHMLFLDARTLERRVLPMPPGTELIVIDSGVPRTLAASKYNERRAECEEAAAPAGRAHAARCDRRRRAGRAAGAAAANAPATSSRKTCACWRRRRRRRRRPRFGELMNASHASLRDDYEVSMPALDTLCDMLRAAARRATARA